MVCDCGHTGSYLLHRDYEKANLAHVPLRDRSSVLIEWFGAFGPGQSFFGPGQLLVSGGTNRWSGISLVM